MNHSISEERNQLVPLTNFGGFKNEKPTNDGTTTTGKSASESNAASGKPKSDDTTAPSATARNSSRGVKEGTDKGGGNALQNKSVV